MELFGNNRNVRMANLEARATSLKTPRIDYETMLEYAKTLHPSATVAMGTANNWVITIESEFGIDNELPDSYRGTPAYALYQKPDSMYHNGLDRWAHNNSYSHLPLVGAADVFNLIKEEGKFLDKELESLNVTSGFLADEPDWESMTEKDYDEYRKNKDIARGKVKDYFKDKNAALCEKWNV